MAFFQKKPQITSSLPLYTMGAEKTLLVIGLGNPGKQYEGTRHNIGFAVIDDFAKRNDFPNWQKTPSGKGTVSIASMGQSRVILAKPTTFMNASGEAAHAIQAFYKITNAQTVVVYDELALEFGQIRARVGGESAGHNGIKSLISHIGDDFGRLRVGISGEHSKQKDAADYVLSSFSQEERQLLPAIVKEAGVMLTEYIYSGQLPHETRSVA